MQVLKFHQYNKCSCRHAGNSHLKGKGEWHIGRLISHFLERVVYINRIVVDDMNTKEILMVSDFIYVTDQ